MARRRRRSNLRGKGTEAGCERAYSACLARASGGTKKRQKARGRCLARLNKCRRKAGR